MSKPTQTSLIRRRYRGFFVEAFIRGDSESLYGTYCTDRADKRWTLKHWKMGRAPGTVIRARKAWL